MGMGSHLRRLYKR